MIEDVLNRVEYNLSCYAKYPIVGAIPAALKILMGAVQCVVALIFALASLFAAPCSKKARTFSARALGHVVHGFANMVAGTLEATPGLGTLIYLRRSSERNETETYDFLKDSRGNFHPYNKEPKEGFIPVTIEYLTLQWGKWVAYKELIPKDNFHSRDIKIKQEAKGTSGNFLANYFSYKEAKEKNLPIPQFQHFWLIV